VKAVGMGVLSVLSLVPALTRADAQFVVLPMGSGFQDATPAPAVPGNPGTTLGAQRLAALERAAAIWGKQLDSNVPITIAARFSELGCDEEGMVLAQTAPAREICGIVPTSGALELCHVGPLADRIAGVDLSPGRSDIFMEFNSSVDGACGAGSGWYYGFEPTAHEGSDFIEIALHELAHGLGFSSLIDERTGQPEMPGTIDPYSAHVFDLDLQQDWSQLTEKQRVSSAVKPRRVVWNGPEVQRASARFLSPTGASLHLSPAVAELSGVVTKLAGSMAPSVTGPLVLTEPADACGDLVSPLAGAIALVQPGCSPREVADRALRAGAVGVLMTTPLASSAASYGELPSDAQWSLPVLLVTAADAARLTRALGAGPVSATLADGSLQRRGTDEQGRPFLYTPASLENGSSVSHFDTSASPQLLMEPNYRGTSTHEVDLTLAVLRDIGWTPFCGNGVLDADEQCDDGADNDDLEPGSCRTTCRAAGCGDGVLDAAEACDWGGANSDSLREACRTDCQLAHCGDGVLDRGEACDRGEANSDRLSDACRTTCQVARCGDGVVDRGEACDGNAPCTAACGLPTDEFPPWSKIQADEPDSRGGCSAGAPSKPRQGASVGRLLLMLGLAAVLRRRRRAHSVAVK
jgi:hypothetical protein